MAGTRNYSLTENINLMFPRQTSVKARESNSDFRCHFTFHIITQQHRMTYPLGTRGCSAPLSTPGRDDPQLSEPEPERKWQALFKIAAWWCYCASLHLWVEHVLCKLSCVSMPHYRDWGCSIVTTHVLEESFWESREVKDEVRRSHITAVCRQTKLF